MARMTMFLAAVSGLSLASAAGAQVHDGHQAPMPPAPRTQSTTEAQAQPGDPHAGHDMATAQDAHESNEGHQGHQGHDGGEEHDGMRAALGPYPVTRESSGTAWQPDSSTHAGIMANAGSWSLMGHARLNLVHDWQGGPRGDSKSFVSGMVMGMAQRPVGSGMLQVKAMLSPDPLMGKRGYPLLLASGETADGQTALVDRQHPHDFFMELSASLSHPVGRNGSLFVYAALPGEPAFGPPAFMHREAALDSPEAPITHHWLDSTHISFGVLTGGLVIGNAKVELSRFNAREPDQHRWNIETGKLDSTAVRLSINPTRTLSLQGSWGRFVAPEQLEPEENQTRWSASALWADDVGPGKASATLAWGRKSHHDEQLDALALETGYRLKRWTLFGRAEWTENDELVHDVLARVAKVSVGGIYDIPIAPQVAFGIGGLVSHNIVPNALDDAYGGNRQGAMALVRLKVE